MSDDQDLLHDATVRLDEQRLMTERAERQLEKARAALRFKDGLIDDISADVERAEEREAALSARLAETDAKLAAARLALSACREVREARDA